MVSDFCDTSNQLGKSTDAKEPDFTLDQSVSSNEEMKGESDSADEDWNNSADVGESDSADEDWNSSADVGESDSAADDMKEESLNNIAEEILESNKGDRKKGGKKREAKCRAAKVCPLPYCKKLVIHLPRHLHNVHHWSKNQSQGSVSRFQLRKKYTFRTNETAKAGNRKKKVDENKPYVDYHKRKVCPVPGCVKIVKRMPPHLKKVHHLEPKSKKYKDLLSRTFAFSNKPYSTKKRREDAYDVKLPELEVDRKIKVSFVPGKVVYKNEDDGYEKESKDSDLDEGKDEYDKYEDYEEEDKDTSDNEYVTDEHEDSNEPEYMDDPNSDENEPCSDKHAVSDLLDKVCDWLISSDGSHLDTRTAKQHVNQLQFIEKIATSFLQPDSLPHATLLRQAQLNINRNRYLKRI